MLKTKIYLQKTSDDYIRGIPYSVWSDILKIMHDKFASKGHRECVILFIPDGTHIKYLEYKLKRPNSVVSGKTPYVNFYTYQYKDELLYGNSIPSIIKQYANMKYEINEIKQNREIWNNDVNENNTAYEIYFNWSD